MRFSVPLRLVQPGMQLPNCFVTGLAGNCLQARLFRLCALGWLHLGVCRTTQYHRSSNRRLDCHELRMHRKPRPGNVAAFNLFKMPRLPRTPHYYFVFCPQRRGVNQSLLLVSFFSL